MFPFLAFNGRQLLGMMLFGVILFVLAGMIGIGFAPTLAAVAVLLILFSVRPALTTAAVLLMFGLAACATTPTGKTVVVAAKVGADLKQAAAVLNLAQPLTTLANVKLPAVVITDLQKTAVALNTAGDELESSGATSGDVAANLQLAVTSLGALRDAYASLGTAQGALAAKLQGYTNALLAAVLLYNADAPALGLPAVPVPA